MSDLTTVLMEELTHFFWPFDDNCLFWKLIIGNRPLTSLKICILFKELFGQRMFAKSLTRIIVKATNRFVKLQSQLSSCKLILIYYLLFPYFLEMHCLLTFSYILTCNIWIIIFTANFLTVNLVISVHICIQSVNLTQSVIGLTVHLVTVFQGQHYHHLH